MPTETLEELEEIGTLFGIPKEGDTRILFDTGFFVSGLSSSQIFNRDGNFTGYFFSGFLGNELFTPDMRRIGFRTEGGRIMTPQGEYTRYFIGGPLNFNILYDQKQE